MIQSNNKKPPPNFIPLSYSTKKTTIQQLNQNQSNKLRSFNNLLHIIIKKGHTSTSPKAAQNSNSKAKQSSNQIPNKIPNLLQNKQLKRLKKLNEAKKKNTT